MIPRHTIDQILQTAHIEEVIGEFVQLKKSGSNFKGLSPFSNEKTPSFYVSPAKGIFKDFSSGKGGNVVSFLMEHERMSYPEALRFLADKYNIEIEEETPSEEVLQERSDRENLSVVMQYAQRYLENELWNGEEGKAIGLTYFQERGFRDDIIKKFQLGYHPEGWDNFTNKAKEEGYEERWLVESGMTKKREDKLFDFFRGRVMFPIRNIAGKTIAFGGRTLKTDKKIAKYFNSPEHALYNKSSVLYGIYLAKNSIVKKDRCYLVEGYTDVIALHQAGVENVVASSGTALTEGQIKLIKRYTPNITMLYDGDAAGIKASFRGIDLILSQGMNVKVVLFPDGEDPDSFSRKVSSTELQDYIAEAEKDFLSFKTDVLLKDAEGDPIKRAQLIRDIVESIAKIPDGIQRSVYIQACAARMDVEERVLTIELNKLLRNELKKTAKQDIPEPPPPPLDPVLQAQVQEGYDTRHQEKDLLRLLLNYGNYPVTVNVEMEEETLELQVSVAEYLYAEMSADRFEVKDSTMNSVWQQYVEALENESFPELSSLANHPDPKVSTLVADLVSHQYQLSENWELRHRIYPKTEDMDLDKAVRDCINRFKLSNVMVLIKTVEEQLKTANEEDMIHLLQYKKLLDKAKIDLSGHFGSTVL